MDEGFEALSIRGVRVGDRETFKTVWDVGKEGVVCISGAGIK